MKYKGKIKELKKLILSDPHYKKGVWCRYQRDFKEKNDWNVTIDLVERDYTDKYEDKEYHTQGINIDVFMIPDKYNFLSKFIEIKEDSICYNESVEIKKTSIGMDTAQVAIGANESAKVIENFSKEENPDWRPYFSLKTGTDGIFGEVHEFYLNNTFFAIHFDGWLSDNTDYSIDDILKYLEEKLDIKELVQVKDSEIEK